MRGIGVVNQAHRDDIEHYPIHYERVDELKKHLYAYLMNYNSNFKLRTIGRITTFESIL